MEIYWEKSMRRGKEKEKRKDYRRKDVDNDIFRMESVKKENRENSKVIFYGKGKEEKE